MNQTIEQNNQIRKDSLHLLFEEYLFGDTSEKRKNAEAVLSAVNKEVLDELVDDFFSKSEYANDEHNTDETIERILEFGYLHATKTKYLKIYLEYLFEDCDHLDIEVVRRKLCEENNTIPDECAKDYIKYLINHWIANKELLGLLSDSQKAIYQDALITDIITHGLNNEYYLEILDEDHFFELVNYSFSIDGGLADYRILSALTKRKNAGRYGDLIRNVISSDLDDKEIVIKFGRCLYLKDDSNRSVLNSVKEYSWLYQIVHTNIFSKDESGISNNDLLAIIEKIDNRLSITKDEMNVIKKYCLDKTDTITREDINIFITFVDACQYLDSDFMENVLILSYKKSSEAMVTNKSLYALVRIHSEYGYKEFLNRMFLAGTTERKIQYAITLLKNYPDKASNIKEYAESIADTSLVLSVNDFIEKNIFHDTDISFLETQKIEIEHDKDYSCRLIKSTESVNELLLKCAIQIRAHTFYAAVGYVYSSGLQLLDPLFSIISNQSSKSELIIGALQNYEILDIIQKMNKQTACSLNKMIIENKVNLYTYNDAFYHGKFYFLCGDEKGYAIIGSSNMTQSAYLENYELDLLISFKVGSIKENELKDWYEALKIDSQKIYSLEPGKFIDTRWNSELDIYKYRKTVSKQLIREKIDNLSDEETKQRLNLWMTYDPEETFENLGVSIFKDYIAFQFKVNERIVLESFSPRNAYYVFKGENIDQVLDSLIYQRRREVPKSRFFLKKGNHINDKKRLKDLIASCFTDSDD